MESSYKIADVIIDYELNTHVIDICFSGCTTIFLGGEKRTMARASKLGFHRSWWGHEEMKAYYESEKENSGWSDVWEFASWVHDDAQEEIYRAFTFLLERNITAIFAIKTLKAESEDGWYPRRKELIEAKFLTQ